MSNSDNTITAPLSLCASMAAAFGAIEAATKSAANPHFKSKYADLSSVIDAIKPALVAHGLFFTQRPEPASGGVAIETVVHHANGDSMSLGTVFVPVNKADAQAYGSALTYARRYALVTAFGVPTEDDDGNAAAKSHVEAPKPVNWGGRYPTKTALKNAMHLHHGELERLGIEGSFDDLEGYLASPEYQDFIATATDHAPYYLEGPRHQNAPDEFIQTFALEQKAKDMIALRGGRAGGDY